MCELLQYLSGNGLLQMFVVSDLVEPVFGATVILEMFSWFDHFAPIYASNRSITILPQISTEIPMDEKIRRLIRWLLYVTLIRNIWVAVGFKCLPDFGILWSVEIVLQN